jgi:hypothetical protein
MLGCPIPTLVFWDGTTTIGQKSMQKKEERADGVLIN